MFNLAIGGAGEIAPAGGKPLIDYRDVLDHYFDRYQIFASYAAAPGQGIPIGNLTSQYFANHYLAALDHLSLEQLRVGRYVRYMDDIVLWDKEKSVLEDTFSNIDAYCRENLRLNLKPRIINRCAAGVPFCGFLVKSGGSYLLDKTRRLDREDRY